LIHLRPTSIPISLKICPFLLQPNSTQIFVGKCFNTLNLTYFHQPYNFPFNKIQNTMSRPSFNALSKLKVLAINGSHRKGNT
jgi:hypothetical protein